MAHMRHPVTGKSVRTEVVCEKNPPSYEHEFVPVVDTWAEFISRCRHCGYEL